MAPAEDTTVHWDYYIPFLDNIFFLNPSSSFPDHPTAVWNPSSRDLSGHHPEMTSMPGSSALLHGQSLYENSYDTCSASGYAHSSANAPTKHHPSPPLSSWSFPTSDISNTRSFMPSTQLVGNLDFSGLSGHVESKSQPSSPPVLQSTLARDLPPSHSDSDYMGHDNGIYRHLSPDPNESLLSPLPLSWPGNRLSLSALPGDIYPPGLMFSGALGPVNGAKDISVTERDDDFSSTSSFPSLFWSSPSSVDTDLDDESISSSTASLSPDYLDAELHHSPLDSDEDEEFEDDRYYSQLSPPMHHDDHRYHIDQYPPFDFYDEAISPESPLPSNSDSFGLPPISFPKHDQWSLYNTDDASTNVPCSPSRRRSADLPLLDEDPFGLQGGGASLSMDDTTTTNERKQRNFWLSLPGAETDDDLIPRELGSKNYVPDPTITVPTTPPFSSSGGLLLWDVDGGDLMYRRSPSPEDLYLDPTILADLPKDESGAEAQKLFELKQRTTGRESWEREKSRELSTLLRLKLKLDENGSPSNIGTYFAKSDANHPTLQGSGTDTFQGSVSLSTSASAVTTSTTPATAIAGSQVSTLPDSTRMSSLLPDSPAISIPNSANAHSRHFCCTASSAPPTCYRILSHKPAISSMDQLVANMVFHRQQEPLRKKPTRARTWSPPSAGKSYPTPKSPLRQVLLPENSDDDDTEEDEGSSRCLVQFVVSPQPLSPLCLLETDLAPSPTHQ